MRSRASSVHERRTQAFSLRLGALLAFVLVVPALAHGEDHARDVAELQKTVDAMSKGWRERRGTAPVRTTEEQRAAAGRVLESIVAGRPATGAVYSFLRFCVYAQEDGWIARLISEAPAELVLEHWEWCDLALLAGFRVDVSSAHPMPKLRAEVRLWLKRPIAEREQALARRMLAFLDMKQAEQENHRGRFIFDALQRCSAWSPSLERAVRPAVLEVLTTAQTFDSRHRTAGASLSHFEKPAELALRVGQAIARRQQQLEDAVVGRLLGVVFLRRQDPWMESHRVLLRRVFEVGGKNTRRTVAAIFMQFGARRGGPELVTLLAQYPSQQEMLCLFLRETYADHDAPCRLDYWQSKVEAVKSDR